MKKYSNLSYDECVNLGKDFLQQRKEIRIEMCLLTLRVCEIRIGGHHANSDIYSMAKFAADLGMSKFTLRKWMEDFRNVELKLPEIPSPDKSKVVREVAKKVNRNTPRETVLQIYNDALKLTNDDFTLRAQIKNAKSIRNFAYEYNFKNLNHDEVLELKLIVESSLNAINTNISRAGIL